MGELKAEAKTAAQDSKTAWDESKKSQISALQSADKQIEASKSISTQAMIDEKLEMKKWEKQSKDSSSAVSKNVSSGISEAKNAFKTADYSQEIKEGYTTSMNNSQESIKKDSYAAGKAGTEGMANGLRDTIATAALGTASRETALKLLDALEGKSGLDEHSPSKKTYESGKNAVLGLTNGITDNKSTATNAVHLLATDITSKFNSEFTAISTTFKSKGKGLVDSIISGMNESKNGFDGTKFASNLMSNVVKKLGNMKSDFKGYGKDLADSFVAGLKSVYIPSPYVWVKAYKPQDLGNGQQFYIPEFGTGWYKKGGLFTDPSIIGVGEAGDEAVVPLENRKAMSRIADAIVENTGGLGLSKQDIVDAVVYAMATNPQNERPIQVSAVLYTEDNEVLARAVADGNRRMDYRYNPTPAY